MTWTICMILDWRYNVWSNGLVIRWIIVNGGICYMRYKYEQHFTIIMFVVVHLLFCCD